MCVLSVYVLCVLYVRVCMCVCVQTFRKAISCYDLCSYSLMCYSLFQQLTLKEFYLKIIGKKLYTFRVCPSTKVSSLQVYFILVKKKLFIWS